MQNSMRSREIVRRALAPPDFLAVIGPHLGDRPEYVRRQHLRRYLGEFDFRYNERSALGVSDTERAAKALKGIEGKRLTYRRTNESPNA